MSFTRTVRGGAWRAALPLAILVVLVSSAACGSRGSKEDAAGDVKAVARVNEAEITDRMVEQAIGWFRAQQPKGSPEPTQGQQVALRRDVIEALINQELFVQKARQEGIEAPKDELERRMQMLEGRYGSAEGLQKALQEAGLDVEQMRGLMERNLQIDAYLHKHVRSRVSISDADVETYFKEHPEQMSRPEAVRASHILVLSEEGKASPEERQAARRKAEGLLERLRKGEDFAELARQNSDDGSAARGGDLGYFPRGQMTPTFERSAFSLKVGQVSGVVETPFGYHVIKVVDRQPARTFQLAEVRDALRKRLASEQVERRSQEFVEALQKESRIERF